MAISIGIALAGIGIAFVFWYQRPSVPAALARQFSGVHRLLLNKYYLDEIYDAVIVQPIKQVSTGALWKGVDAGVIDGSVNGVGAGVQSLSSSLRRLQTGSIRDLRGVALPRRGAGPGMVLVDLRFDAAGCRVMRPVTVGSVFRWRLQTCSR